VSALQIDELTPAQGDLRRQVHEAIAKISQDVGKRYTFNTAIAAVMELVNALYKAEDETPQGRAVMQEALEAIVLMLAPIVPHVCHVLWRALGHAGAVVDAPWPKADAHALARDTVDLVVQVNGKLRGHVSVAKAASQADIEAAALVEENVQRFVEGKAVKKIIVVPGKLVNIVVAQ